MDAIISASRPFCFLSQPCDRGAERRPLAWPFLGGNTGRCGADVGRREQACLHPGAAHAGGVDVVRLVSRHGRSRRFVRKMGKIRVAFLPVFHTRSR